MNHRKPGNKNGKTASCRICASGFTDNYLSRSSSEIKKDETQKEGGKDFRFRSRVLNFGAGRLARRVKDRMNYVIRLQL